MTDIQDDLAQVIANSFFGMEAGYLPTESWELPSPSSGDFQLAFDIVSSSVIRRIQADAWNKGRRDGLYDGRANNYVSFTDRPNPYKENDA